MYTEGSKLGMIIVVVSRKMLLLRLRIVIRYASLASPSSTWGTSCFGLETEEPVGRDINH